MKGFTLAEILITLAIIGVVAAVSIPSVISNAQQQEFKTGLRKAVSVLNSAITMNMALDGETPYDNANLFGYLQRHMAVLRSTVNINHDFITKIESGGNNYNSAFYTTDGMRFEMSEGGQGSKEKRHYLYKSGTRVCEDSLNTVVHHSDGYACGGCGSLGLNNNPDGTTKPPCLIMVDVNGDRKPNPANINCKQDSCATFLKYSDPEGKKLTDLFSIIITDKEAIPYGAAAQKAMYQSQK
ncbi:MAG: type II secretion system protein [bacterium]|nr:type II secretion system protein [bacterium]